MKLEKITKLKNDKYKLKIDDQDIITYDEVILKYNLLYKHKIDSLMLTNILSDTFYYNCYNKALKFVLKRVRSVYEVEQFISKFNLSIEEKNSILKKLIDLKLVNDLMYVKSFINDRLLLSKDGPKKIINDLLNSNIDNNLIESEMGKIDNQLFKDKLKKLILKKINSNHKLSNNQLKNKILMEMVNLGYEKDDILEILDNNTTDDYDILLKEYHKLYNRLSKKYSGYELDYKVKQGLYAKGFRFDDIKKEDLI